VDAGRPEPALDQPRFILAVDDSPFLRRFARDAFLGEVTHRLAGLRPLRTDQALFGTPAPLGGCGRHARELLEPYGEWASLASVYLLAGFSRSTDHLSGFSATYRRSS
jgi:hypothetical protein